MIIENQAEVGREDFAIDVQFWTRRKIRHPQVIDKGRFKRLSSVRFAAVRAAVKLHHSLWNEGTGRGSGARGVVDRLGSSARRAPSTESPDTDLLGSRAIGQLRPAFCKKHPHHYGF